MGRVDHFGPNSYVSRSRDCSASGCMNSTREGKPFCPDHVEMHPYVQEVVAFRKLRDAEIVRIADGRQVADDSLLFKEIIIHITNLGSKTVERLACDLMIDIEAIKKLIKAMKRQKLIKIGRSKRGSTVVRLP